MEAEKEGNVMTYAMWGGLYLGGWYIVRDLIELGIYTNLVSFSGLCLLSLLTMVSLAVTLCLLMRSTNVYKSECLKADVSYFKVLNYGFCFFFFASMIYAVYIFLVLAFFKPDLIACQKDFIDVVLQQVPAEDEASQNMMISVKDIFDKQFALLMGITPKDFAMNALFDGTTLGFFLCLVTSIFLSKKTKE